MQNYESIHYLNCPHFTIGRVDQWSESGYLLFENNVYHYEEDRKEQCGTTTSPMTINDFLTFAEQHQITIPEEFMKSVDGDS